MVQLYLLILYFLSITEDWLSVNIHLSVNITSDIGTLLDFVGLFLHLVQVNFLICITKDDSLNQARV